MRLFDLHCDTIEELKKRGEDYLNCTTQFSLRDRDKFQKAVQVMAVFVPDDIRGQEAVQFSTGLPPVHGRPGEKDRGPG
ncbi:MAG: hypothetical protein ACLR0U_13270 [Enterocloster clostridioformis]